MRQETRPWGRFEVLVESEFHWFKRIIIAPGQSLSHQYHLERTEFWLPETPGVCAWIGDRDLVLWYPAPVPYQIPAGTAHHLFNPGADEVSVLEWATGSPDESDIVRLHDQYGRA